MARRKILRKVINPPHFRGFIPLGINAVPAPVMLGFEEYEAIRLCDFDRYQHVEAARVMNVSRPTFARIYDEARRKVALAFVMGAPLLFEGGKVYYDSDWYDCRSCGCRFNRVDKSREPVKCGLCGSVEIVRVEQESHVSGPVSDGEFVEGDEFMARGGFRERGHGAGRRSGRIRGRGGAHSDDPDQQRGSGRSHLCRCMECGFETQVPVGIPCSHTTCHKCGAVMHRNRRGFKS